MPANAEPGKAESQMETIASNNGYLKNNKTTP